MNSYKRFQPQSWAPTRSPGPDNRTAGFRVVGHGPSLRIECRIPGADCNPYLAFAAALASGLDGIEQRTEPPPPFIGRRLRGGRAAAGAAHAAATPPTLLEGERVRARAPSARTSSSTTPTSSAPRTRPTQRAVTDWERARYFERI